MTAASRPYLSRTSWHAGYWKLYHSSTRMKSLTNIVRDGHRESIEAGERRTGAVLIECHNADHSGERLPIHASPRVRKARDCTHAHFIDSRSLVLDCCAAKRASNTAARTVAAKRGSVRYFRLCRRHVQELGGALHNLESIAVFSHFESGGSMHAVSWGCTHVIEDFINTDVALPSTSRRVWLTKRR